MKNLRDKVAAITGAGSGIGQATAVLLAEEGCHLAISDINEEGLQKTADKCRHLGVNVTTQILDVAQKEPFYSWAEQVIADHGKANIIINNAGVALGATIQDMAYDDFEWLMGINFWGVVYGTKAFLPHLEASEEGHIVNISSLFGLMGMPTQSAYNAAKFGVRGFTESLIQELGVKDSHVSATCVHPGGIKTNIAKSARIIEAPGMIDEQATQNFEKAFITSPEKAAKDIVNAIKKKKRRLVIGIDAKTISFVQRLLPSWYHKLIIKGFKAQRKQLDKAS